MSDLSGKTVLVTGASKGIGAQIARIAGEAGAFVIAHYGGDQDGAEAAVATLPDDRKLVLQADFHDLDSLDRLWSKAIERCGRIDALVNNAATMIWDCGFDKTPQEWDAAWQESVAVNLLAPARLMRSAVKHYRQHGGGSIITISSWAAQRGVTNPDTIAYGATKSAIHAATQTIARAFASDSILAYVIAPGVVRTRLSEQFAETQGGESAISKGLASGNWVEPEEIAELVTFLLSGVAPQLSGATLDMNGATYIR